MRQRRNVTVVLAASLCSLPLLAIPQEEKEGLPDEIEEIIVYAPKTMKQLRRERDQAEENYYDVFNAFNDDDQFDIHCRNVSQTGSRIKHRVCDPNFARRARLSRAQAIMLRRPHVSGASVMSFKRRELMRKLEALTISHPELFDAFSGFAEAQMRLDVEQHLKCRDDEQECP